MLTDNKSTSILAVTSGKGGVGKSFTTVNLAEIITYMGYRVAVIDADIGLSNSATLLNESVAYTVKDWVNGECYLEELPQKLDAFTLITANDKPGLNNVEKMHLMNALDQVVEFLKPSKDFIFIDTPAGVGEMTLWSLDQADIGLLLLVDEPTAVADAYRLCKYIYSIAPNYKFVNIVNFSADIDTAKNTNEQFNNVLRYFLEKQTEYLGFIPYTKEVSKLVCNQNTILDNRKSLTELEKQFFSICHSMIDFLKKDRPRKQKFEQLI